MLPLSERFPTGLNPLMVKAAQQSLRSRGLLVCGLIALVVPLFMYAGPGSIFMRSWSGREGHTYFVFIASVLSIVMSLMLPVKAAVELNGEIKSRTLDLLLLTNLSPWELAVGRFQAVVLELLLLLSFVMPFAVAALGLGGIGARTILCCLLFVSLVGCAQCSAALLAMTTRLISRGYSVLALMIFALQLSFAGFGGLIVALAERLETPLLLWACVVLLLVMLLCLRMTADILTSGDASTSAYSKLVMWLLLAAYLAPLWVGTAYGSLPYGTEQRWFYLGFGLTAYYLFVLIWSAAAEREAAPRVSRIWFLSDGYTATVLYAALTSAVVAAMSGEAWVLAPIYFSYFVFFTGLAAALHAFLPRRMRTSGVYFGLVVFWGILDLFAAGPFIVRDQSLLPAPPPTIWRALVPAALDGDSLVKHPTWLVLPLAVGLGAIVLARVRNARMNHGPA